MSRASRSALAASLQAFGAVGLAPAPAPARPLIAARVVLGFSDGLPVEKLAADPRALRHDAMKRGRERKAPMQLAALRALAAGDATPRDVSRLAGLDNRNVSSVLRCLLARGWAMRVKPGKARELQLHGNVAWLYRMTAAGRQALEAAAA